MVYKLDPENRYESFLSEAYKMYLKMVYTDEQSVETVRVVTQEVPAGKTIQELEEMGILASSDNIASPLLSEERRGYSTFANLTPEDNEVKEVAPETEKPTIEPVKVKAERAFWYTSDISSEVADDIKYIKRRRAATKRIIKWLETNGVSSSFVGGPLNFKQCNNLSNLQEKMNSLEILHERLINATNETVRYTYNFNGEYKDNSTYEDIPGFLENVEDRLSKLIYHLSSKWVPEVEKFYIERCGRIKRYGNGPEVIDTFADSDSKHPLLEITFITDTFDSIAGLGDEPHGKAAFVGVGERMHIDLTDFLERQPDLYYEGRLDGSSHPAGIEMSDNRADIPAWYDKLVSHELGHFWSKDGFISNTALIFIIPNKVFSEGFCELFSAGSFNDILKLMEVFYRGGTTKEELIEFFDDASSYTQKMENAFSIGSSFSYTGAGAAVFFLAIKMYKKGYYILDFYNEINKKLGDESFDDIFKRYSGYEDADEWEEDFLENWAKVLCEAVIEKLSLNSNEIYSIDSKIIGGPGAVSLKSDHVADNPPIPREDFGGQNVFKNQVGRKSALQLFKEASDKENQLVYFCEDVTYSNEENFAGILDLTEDILEVYCIVITHNPPGSHTSEGIKVYDGQNHKEFTKSKTTKDKTLYTIGLNIAGDNEDNSHLVEVLNMIPDTVNRYQDNPKEMALGNLLLSLELSTI